jgi:hypothetical protein
MWRIPYSVIPWFLAIAFCKVGTFSLCVVGTFSADGHWRPSLLSPSLSTLNRSSRRKLPPFGFNFVLLQNAFFLAVVDCWLLHPTSHHDAGNTHPHHSAEFRQIALPPALLLSSCVVFEVDAKNGNYLPLHSSLLWICLQSFRAKHVLSLRYLLTPHIRSLLTSHFPHT